MQAENTKNNIKVVSFGCRLNALECEKIQKMLGEIVQTAIIVNTCAVTGEAERQSGQTVRKLARENPNVPIFITGCAATRNPTLFCQIPNTVVIPNNQKLKLSAYIDGLRAIDCENARIDKFTHSEPKLSKKYIQVQNGCNHQCTYCVTRLLRGASVSFPYDEILSAARKAISDGFCEIVLTGVDTASYARDGRLISDVCRDLLHDVPEIRRLRLSSVDPASPEIFKIINLIHDNPRMARHLHLSMQSGSDAVLRDMQRRHNADTVRKIVAVAGPDITFSWDIICGFPNESDAKFTETMNLVADVRPIKIHAFPFSPRPDTVAATMPNQVAHNIAKERVQTISDAARKIRHEFMQSQLGTVVNALAEENNIARDDHDIDIVISGARVAPRTMQRVKLQGISGDAFIGEIV